MRGFIAIVLLVVVAIGVTGFTLGWFKFFTSPNEHSLTVDRAKVRKDRDAVVGVFRSTAKDLKKDAAANEGTTERDAFLARTESRFKAMDRNLAELKTKANSKNGFEVTKEKMNQAIGELNAKTNDARVELQELKTATPERWDALKAHLSGALEELEAGFEKTFARFMNEWTLRR